MQDSLPFQLKKKKREEWEKENKTLDFAIIGHATRLPLLGEMHCLLSYCCITVQIALLCYKHWKKGKQMHGTLLVK